MTETQVQSPPKTGIVVGVLAVFSAVMLFWMIIPGIALGVAAIWLGRRDRKRGADARGATAVTLGIVAILLVPAVLLLVGEAEEWGRDCALDPASDPNC